MKLTLTIPALNEEKAIRYPLDSAYDLVDEVVIIDQKSTDKTVEIAKSYGDKIKVYSVDKPENFLLNKQIAIEKASGDWILQLDADEAVSEELKAEIKEVLKGKEQKDGYFIPRKNWFLTRYLMKGGVYPDYVLRLYKKNKASFKLKDLHENVQIDGEVGYLNEALLHQADPDFSRYLMRWDRYTTFDAEELAKKGNLGLGTAFSYMFIKPKIWFFKTYFRHRGYKDGFPGFVFSLFSALRFQVIYIKAWTMKNSKQ